jgi:Protein of unknown function (DUF3108)
VNTTSLHRATAALLAALALTASATTSATTAATACPDGELPASFQLDYDVTASRSLLSISGEGQIRFNSEAGRYRLNSSIKAIGLYEAGQQSEGSIKAGVPAPREFTQTASRRKPRSVSFDRAARELRFSSGAPAAPLAPRTQDRLSLLLALAQALRGEPPEVITLPVAGPSRLSNYRFKLAARESLQLPAGDFETVRYERDNEDDDEHLSIWFAPELCWLPVRLRYTDDRRQTVDQQLRAATLP